MGQEWGSHQHLDQQENYGNIPSAIFNSTNRTQSLHQKRFVSPHTDLMCVCVCGLEEIARDQGHVHEAALTEAQPERASERATNNK